MQLNDVVALGDLALRRDSPQSKGYQMGKKGKSSRIRGRLGNDVCDGYAMRCNATRRCKGRGSAVGLADTTRLSRDRNEQRKTRAILSKEKETGTGSAI